MSPPLITSADGLLCKAPSVVSTVFYPVCDLHIQHFVINIEVQIMQSIYTSHYYNSSLLDSLAK